MKTAASHFVALLTASLCLSASAEDIDIYGRLPLTNDLPNVLLIWDASANWSSDIPVPNCYYTEDGVISTSGPKATAPDKERSSPSRSARSTT